MAEWKSRIVGEGDENPGQLLANPANWRIHPHAQEQALMGILDEVGWVQRGIEILPAYCAVILQRMTDAFPGIKIKKL